MVPATNLPEAEALCATAHLCAARGWVPATSGNFSVRDAATGRILISRSGLDKGAMTTSDLLTMEADGQVLAGDGGKPSAEAALHAVVYRQRPDAHAILHVHTIWNTLLSERFVASGHVILEGYELLKALSGVDSHEYRERVPILRNSQDYGELARQLGAALEENPRAHGVLLSAHGLYTWGSSVAEAKRHLEALEFLFEVQGRKLYAQPGT